MIFGSPRVARSQLSHKNVDVEFLRLLRKMRFFIRPGGTPFRGFLGPHALEVTQSKDL